MLVIKKRVPLGILGDEYKDSYLIVKSISIGEYEALGDMSVKEAVIERLIGGEIQQDEGMVKVTKDNITELPGEVFIEAFAKMTGGELDPKSLGLSTTASSTTDQPPAK